jgi:NADH:ubiquinone oxidoreductase subunit C
MEFNDSESFYNWLNSFESLNGSIYGIEFETYARMQRFLLDKSICSCKKKGKSIDSFYSALNLMKAEDYTRLLTDLGVDYILLKKGEELIAEFKQ